MLRTRSLSISALSYATPLFGLLWLWVFSDIQVANIDYVLIGCRGDCHGEPVAGQSHSLQEFPKGMFLLPIAGPHVGWFGTRHPRVIGPARPTAPPRRRSQPAMIP